MLVHPLQREDIKGVLRKRHGTVGKFAAKRKIKYQALVDWLRGRPNAPVAKLVQAELKRAAQAGDLVALSIKLDHNGETRNAHRLNAEAN